MKEFLLPAQLKASKLITEKLDKYGIALLWGEVRSGKTRPFLHAARNYKKILVVTKKDAIKGIISEAKVLNLNVDVTTYQSVHKMGGGYDLVVFDESHLNIANQSPKPSTIWRICKKFTKDVDIIFSTGTPTAEGLTKLYHMLALSDDSPFNMYKRFTLWFEDYGIPKTSYFAGNEVPTYKVGQVDKIVNAVKHLVVRLKRSDTGHKHEAEDVIHNVLMVRRQKRLLQLLKRDSLVYLPDGVILADTPAKYKIKRHQISGGIGVNLEDNGRYLFKRSNKILYIKEHFNVNTTIILAHYIVEQEHLSKIFPHTGSVTKLSSGVDLSHFETMVIFSMGFSSANYIQVRARMMNVSRETKVKVHYLMSGVDKDIYFDVMVKDSNTNIWYDVKEP